MIRSIGKKPMDNTEKTPIDEKPPVVEQATIPKGPDAPVAQLITADELIGDELPNFPATTANPDAVKADEPKPVGPADQSTEKPSGYSGKVFTDSEGREFDPNVYKKDTFGNPLLIKGKFVRLSGGRPPKNGGATKPVEPSIENPANPPQQKTEVAGNAPGSATFAEINPPQNGEDMKYRALAEQAVIITTGFAASIISPAWALKNDAEKDMMATPLAAYFKSKGMEDLSPGWMCVAVFAVYASARVKDETTRMKFAKLMGWVKGKFYSLVIWWKTRGKKV